LVGRLWRLDGSRCNPLFAMAENTTPTGEHSSVIPDVPSSETESRVASPNEDRTLRLWPIALLLGVVLWIFTTTGGSQILVNEMLSEAYDSQGEHLLRGNVDVDGDAIRHEVMVVNGKSRMYFGPFPALVRIPLDFVYPKGRGLWSRITAFSAAMIALGAFTGLVRIGLRSSQLSRRWRYVIGTTAIVGFALGSPLLLLLGNPSIYGEAIIWGLAWSIAALYFAFRSREAEGTALTRSLLAFSLCVAATVLSRATFGAPLVLLAPVLAWGLWKKKNLIRNLAVLFLPAGIGVLCHFYISYAKFGNLSGMNLNYSINPVQREFAQKHGLFQVKRVPYSFADYFFLRRPQWKHDPPYINTWREAYNLPTLFVQPVTETYSSLIWCSPWILFGAAIGIILLFLPKGSNWADRIIAAILLLQVIAILCFMGLAQRYLAEFFPFLVFTFILFLARSRIALKYSRYLLIALVAVSVVINSLATISWMIDADMNVPGQTKNAWRQFLSNARH
jgi:hypothetical protein